MAYGQQRQHARTQLWQTIDSLTRVVETRSYGFAVGENHNQGKEEHLQLAHFEIVLGTHQLSLEEFGSALTTCRFLATAARLGGFSSTSSATSSSFVLLLLIIPAPAREPPLIPRRPHTSGGTVMLSGSSAPVPKLNTAAARKAGRITIVHKINCSLERDILFRGSMRKPLNVPVTPCPISTMVMPISTINPIQSAIMDVEDRLNNDNASLENKVTSIMTAIATSNPTPCHHSHISRPL